VPSRAYFAFITNLPRLNSSPSLLFGPIRNRTGVSAILQMALLLAVIEATKGRGYEREFWVNFACGSLAATALVVLIPLWRGATPRQRIELVFPMLLLVFTLAVAFREGFYRTLQ